MLLASINEQVIYSTQVVVFVLKNTLTKKQQTKRHYFTNQYVEQQRVTCNHD